MKLIDCSACIGYGTVNRRIVNHEDYPVIERVKQAADAAELLEQMDFCGIDEAVVFHQTMYDVAPDYGNALFLSDERNFTRRLHGTIAMLPSVSDQMHAPERLLDTIERYNLFGVRAYPQQNRYMLDAVTCGDTLDMLAERRIPLYLSPMENWEHIFAVLKEFPTLTVIITNYGLWGSARYFYPLVKAYNNVYIDTSDYQEINGIAAFVSKFGSERMLFGTNYPCDNMGGPIATLLGANISAEDRENIAHRNIERLMDCRGRIV